MSGTNPESAQTSKVSSEKAILVFVASLDLKLLTLPIHQARQTTHQARQPNIEDQQTTVQETAAAAAKQKARCHA
jgi:hypothetical protein